MSAAADSKHGIPYVVVYLSEDLLGRYDQAHDLPYSHLEVHLRELEQALEKARHSDLIPAGRCGRGAKVGWPTRRPWEGNVWIHRALGSGVSSMRLWAAVHAVGLE
jgi:hypothetical protein